MNKNSILRSVRFSKSSVYEGKLAPQPGEFEPTEEAYILIDRLEAGQIKKAYDHCREVTRRGSRSFYLGARLLPPAKRRAVWAFYTFCRTSDDLVDENQSSLQVNAQTKLRWLEHWEKQLRRCLEGQLLPGRPGMVAFARALADYTVPPEPLFELLEGVKMDLTKTRYRDFEELEQYCYRVASTVGLIMSEIIGYRDPAALGYAVKLGIAMQLTNILRDVGEDGRLGRIYLPLNELEKFGYSEEDLLEGKINSRWQALMRFQIDRARRYYREAWPGISLLDPGGQRAVRVAARFYSRILNQIEANRYDVFSRRAVVPTPLKLAILLADFGGPLSKKQF